MSLPARHHKSESGFTLVELLVAIALLATVAAMVFGSLITTNRVIESGRDLSAREQAARRVLRVMADDISLSKQDGGYQWVGVNGFFEGQPADTLAVLAVNDGAGGTAARESDMIRVVYTRERDRLIRFAKKTLYGLTNESINQVELADNVKAFNLRYFDAQSRRLDNLGLTMVINHRSHSANHPVAFPDIHQVIQAIWGKECVFVKYKNPISSVVQRSSKTHVIISGVTAVFMQRDNLHLGKRFPDGFHRAIYRGIIVDEGLLVAISICPEGCQSLKRILAPVGNQDDRHYQW